MALPVAGFVVAHEDPAFLDVEPGERPVPVFPVADASAATYIDQPLHVERLLIGDVVCRGDLALRTATTVRAGAVVRVAGRLQLHAPLDYPRDGSLFVSMAIEADDIEMVEDERTNSGPTS